ncbi:rCG45334, partial [Rattus norvegicus]
MSTPCSLWSLRPATSQNSPPCPTPSDVGTGPLTAIITVSSPWNLATYLSPRFTSDSLRGLKRHITLMLHSAGSAIFLAAGTAGREPLPAAQMGWGLGHPGRGQRTTFRSQSSASTP